MHFILLIIKSLLVMCSCFGDDGRESGSAPQNILLTSNRLLP